MANKVQGWAHAEGIHWSYRILQRPETTVLTEQWNRLLKTQLQQQLVGNTSHCWDNVLQEVVYALNFYIILWCCFSYRNSSWDQESRGGNGSEPPTITFITRRYKPKFCSHTFRLCQFRGLHYKERNSFIRQHDFIY